MQKGRMARILLACVFGLVLTLGGMTGTAAAEGNGIQFMWYDANYGAGGQYYRSDKPITVTDAVYGNKSFKKETWKKVSCLQPNAQIPNILLVLEWHSKRD